MFNAIGAVKVWINRRIICTCHLFAPRHSALKLDSKFEPGAIVSLHRPGLIEDCFAVTIDLRSPTNGHLGRTEIPLRARGVRLGKEPAAPPETGKDRPARLCLCA